LFAKLMMEAEKSGTVHRLKYLESEVYLVRIEISLKLKN